MHWYQFIGPAMLCICPVARAGGHAYDFMDFNVKQQTVSVARGGEPLAAEVYSNNVWVGIVNRIKGDKKRENKADLAFPYTSGDNTWISLIGQLKKGELQDMKELVEGVIEQVQSIKGVGDVIFVNRSLQDICRVVVSDHPKYEDDDWVSVEESAVSS
ncbi:Uu.00g012020.m01.CDS01 [Anthostomella pinea]|uniref:Uu.00g012020.m01.CDS01 n=1 Tax=Anthostomella pinea TaxID=933095 RepID=A0AAI8YQ45_9PEZI|nr:Uu.00g012020.m01.CDS01 [Anthostomella pinea]